MNKIDVVMGRTSVCFSENWRDNKIGEIYVEGNTVVLNPNDDFGVISIEDMRAILHKMEEVYNKVYRQEKSNE